MDPQVDVGIVKAEAKFALNFWSKKPTFQLNHLVLQSREKSFYQLPEKVSGATAPEQSIYQTVNRSLSYLSHSNRYFIFNALDLQIGSANCGFSSSFGQSRELVHQRNCYKKFLCESGSGHSYQRLRGI
jgi:hypothetical protein